MELLFEKEKEENNSQNNFISLSNVNEEKEENEEYSNLPTNKFNQINFKSVLEKK